MKVIRIDRGNGKESESTLEVAKQKLEPGFYKTGTIDEVLKSGEQFELANFSFVYRFVP